LTARGRFDLVLLRVQAGHRQPEELAVVEGLGAAEGLEVAQVVQ
jgi:hypothetical protein